VADNAFYFKSSNLVGSFFIYNLTKIIYIVIITVGRSGQRVITELMAFGPLPQNWCHSLICGISVLDQVLSLGNDEKVLNKCVLSCDHVVSCCV